MKNYFRNIGRQAQRAAMLMLALATLSSCGDDSSGDDPEPSKPTTSLLLRSQTAGNGTNMTTIADGAEVDASATTLLTLTYNNTVKLTSSTPATLNGTAIAARLNSKTSMAVDIPLSLEDGKSYTLIVPKGAIVAAENDKSEAPEFKLTFTTKEAYVPPTTSGIDPSPVAAATPQAVNLYNYFKAQYGQKTISSVMANVNWNNDEANRIGKAVGKYPAINCYDFIHIYVPDGNGWINYSKIDPVTEWAKAGGIVSLMWHFNVPVNETTTPGSNGSGVTCTPSETTFKASNALVDGTWENKWFYGQMDKVIDVVLKLKQAGIAATWRPFHEAAGNATHKQQASWTKSWFWWGYDGADTYKKLWIAMFDYFKKKGVDNLIWVWTTQNYNGDSQQYNQDTDWYPGTKYVDIVARDLYGYDAQQNVQEFNEISATYPNKMVILGECGKDTGTGASSAQPGTMWAAGARWGSFMVWYGANMESDDWWKTALTNANVITRDQVDLSGTYKEEDAATAVRNMGLGWNLGNTLDSNGDWIGYGKSTSTYETAWGQPVTKASLMTFLKKEGFGAVRVPVTWWQHLDSSDNIDAAWMNRVEEVVNYVLDAGLYCIINVHHDTGAGDTEWLKADLATFDTNNARFEKIWRQIAERFKDYSQQLVFEGYNEMLDANNQWSQPKNNSSYTALNQFAQTFVSTVRATGGNNATRNLVVTTYSAASGDAVLNGLTMPTDNVNGHLIAEVHSYDPYNWFKQYGTWTAACSNEIKAMFTRLNNRFVSKGIPVIIGEYGTNGETSVSSASTAAQKKAAADQAADMVSQAKALGIATFYWMGLIDGNDRSVPQWTLPTVVEAMRNAYNK